MKETSKQDEKRQKHIGVADFKIPDYELALD